MEETKSQAYTFDAIADDWIVLPTNEGHALVLIGEIVQVVDIGDGDEPNSAHVTLRSESGYERAIFVQMRAIAIAQLLRGGER